MSVIAAPQVIWSRPALKITCPNERAISVVTTSAANRRAIRRCT